MGEQSRPVRLAADWSPDQALTEAGARHAQIILESRQRCEALGLNPSGKPEFEVAAPAAVRDAIERNRSLHLHAMPVMESLYENIINTHSMVLLTDASGTVLHALGDDDFLERAYKVALAPGVDWSEHSKGTNAIGTALAAAEPTVVHADQHYLRANHFLTCSAVPIIDPRGSVCGVLDVTGDFRSYHQHTLALVRMSGQLIENQLFSEAYPAALQIRFHSRPEFIGTLMEGIAAFDFQGRFLAGNRSALFQFGLNRGALETHTFSSLFGVPFSVLLDHQRSASQVPLQARLHNGLIVHVRAQPKTAPRWTASGFEVDEGPGRAAPKPAPQARPSAPKLSGLHYLDTGDANTSAAIAKVRKVIGRDIPIMIIGETGTGKELLAQAIHHDSPRSTMPMVAVNCASIPDTLIESELFGYEDGAFTGARKRGQPGKILAANGGTLFLDEIGDMPMSLQARLLRVLQERVVTPLGSHKSIPVNLMVICATNRNLRELVAQGSFREDLYYRLNGLVVRLPALRDRTDLRVIVQKILHAEPHDGPQYRVAPDVLAMFERYRWPGNFRQLTNVLRAAMVMADDDHVIRREQLPDDMLEEIEHAQVTQASESPGSAMPASATPTGEVALVAPPTLPAYANALETPAAAQPAPAAFDAASNSVSLVDAELALIRRTLARHRGNVSAAARELGISRNTIYRKLPDLNHD